MRTILIALCLLLATGAAASASEFDTPGAACIPGDPAISGSLYSESVGSVRHTTNATAMITMYCPISLPISSPTTLELTYSSNENSTTTYVSAQYIKMNLTTGAITSVATATSRNGSNDGVVRVVTQPISDTYNFSNYAYYVRVDIQRRTTSQTAVFYRVTVR